MIVATISHVSHCLSLLSQVVLNVLAISVTVSHTVSNQLCQSHVVNDKLVQHCIIILVAFLENATID